MLPETVAWASAVANISRAASSPVAALMTCGPQMKRLEFFFVIMMKSISAGLYAAPPAQGPAIIETCGTTPERLTFCQKIFP